MEILDVSSWKAPNNNKIQDHSQNFRDVEYFFPANPKYLNYFNQAVDSFWENKHNTNILYTRSPLMSESSSM